MRPTTDTYISVHSGAKFNFRNPNPDHILIDDIAHSLSMQCRYNGHTGEFYSVAEHSVHIAMWMLDRKAPGNKQMALEALMHDASEAYVCDMPRPLKPFLDPLYQDLETTVERAIAHKYNLALPWNDFIKEADMRICLDEYAVLFEPRLGPCDWTLPYDEPLGITIGAWQPAEAKRAFLNIFKYLTGA